MKYMKARATASAVALFAASVFALPTSGIADSTISPSDVQQGIAISPIPFDKLNLQNRPRALVALGSYLVNGVGDCVGCHTFPRFLRPAGTVPGTNGNFTGNLTGLGSDPTSGNPFLDPLEQSLTGQMKANVNADTAHGSVSYTTPGGVPVYPKNHFLAGGRCFAFFMSRNLTPNNYGLPRGLTEAEFIQVMRTGKDVSCDATRPQRNKPVYGTPETVDPVCSIPEPPAAVLPSFNPEVLQSMPWPTYHSMTDTELKAIYAYLSSLPQATTCNAAANGCAGLPLSDSRIAGLTAGANRYVYSNTDDCPNNVNPAGGNTVGSAPPQ